MKFLLAEKQRIPGMVSPYLLKFRLNNDRNRHQIDVKRLCLTLSTIITPYQDWVYLTAQLSFKNRSIQK